MSPNQRSSRTRAEVNRYFEHDIKHTNDAKAAVEKIVKLRQKNNSDIEEQISKIIPKQVQEMKTSVMNTFDELEKYLLKEAKGLAESLEDYPIDHEIIKWQSLIDTINKAKVLLTNVQQNGTDVQKYIAVKNTENELVTIDSSVRKSQNDEFGKSVFFV